MVIHVTQPRTDRRLEDSNVTGSSTHLSRSAMMCHCAQAWNNNINSTVIIHIHPGHMINHRQCRNSSVHRNQDTKSLQLFTKWFRPATGWPNNYNPKRIEQSVEMLRFNHLSTKCTSYSSLKQNLTTCNPTQTEHRILTNMFY